MTTITKFYLQYLVLRINQTSERKLEKGEKSKLFAKQLLIIIEFKNLIMLK